MHLNDGETLMWKKNCQHIHHSFVLFFICHYESNKGEDAVTHPMTWNIWNEIGSSKLLSINFFAFQRKISAIQMKKRKHTMASASPQSTWQCNSFGKIINFRFRWSTWKTMRTKMSKIFSFRKKITRNGIVNEKLFEIILVDER